MASISPGKPAHDGRPRYVVNYRDPEGRQRRKTFRRKAEAVAFRNMNRPALVAFLDIPKLAKLPLAPA